VDYGTGPMAVNRRVASTGAPVLFVLTLVTAASRSFCLSSNQLPNLGGTASRRLFAGSAGWFESSCWTTYARAYWSPTSTIPPSIPSTATCSRTMAPWPCLPGSHPIAKGKSRRESDMPEDALKGLRFETWSKPAYPGSLGDALADTRIHGTTKRQVGRHVCGEKPPAAAAPAPSKPRYYQYGQRTVHLDGCVEVEAAYYGTPPGWIGRLVNVQWDDLYVRLLDPRTGQLLRSTSARNVVVIASSRRITPNGHRSARSSCWRERNEQVLISAPSAKPFIAPKENWEYVAFWGCWP